MPHEQLQPRPAPLRADARRNQARVLEGARRAFAAGGFEASYHDVARLAGVGVGTVYRRYPKRDELFEAVLLDILDELTVKAEAAIAGEDRWAAFAGFFTDLSTYMRRHAGLSDRVEGRGGARVASARERLLRAVDVLCDRARTGGLRLDVGRCDVIFLAQAAATDGCGLGVTVTDTQRSRALAVILQGLRPSPDEPT